MNIVLLDDELVSLEFLQSRVARLGATPVPFSRPTPALEWCAENDSDVVIVDYMMPEIDGISFARHLHDLPGKADIPVLMITAAGDPVVQQHALDQGVTEFLVKPVDPAQLRERLESLLALRRSAREAEAVGQS